MGYTFDRMDDQRLAAFMHGARNAVIGTIRADGSPHLTPAWFLFRDGQVLIPILKSSVKYRNLVRNPQVSVCVDGGYPDLSAVMVDGAAEFIEGDEERALYLEICARYYDDPADNEQGAATFHRWGEAVTAVVTPTKIVTQDYSGWE